MHKLVIFICLFCFMSRRRQMQNELFQGCCVFLHLYQSWHRIWSECAAGVLIYPDGRKLMIHSELCFSQSRNSSDYHCMSFSSERSKKINVEPVLRFLENNHDFCDTKKEIKVLCTERSAIITGLIRANHLLCFRYYEKSF